MGGSRLRQRRVGQDVDASEISNLPTRRPVQTQGYLGNATVAQLNALGTVAKASYVLLDAGTLTRGSLAVVAGDLVEDDGTDWKLIKAGVSGTVQTGTRVITGSGTIFAPVTAAQAGKIAQFASFTPTFTEVNDGDSVAIAGEDAIDENQIFVYDGPSGAPTGIWFMSTGAAHAFGGAVHTPDTLANVNTKISDATLDDAGDPRTPTAHDLGGAEHSADTLANLNAKVSDATLDDSGAARPPTAHATDHQNGGGDEINVGGLSGVLADAQTPAAHALAGAEHTPSTLAALNTKVSDATLIDTGDSRLSDARTPTAHALAGAEHTPSTLAALNTKVSDATLIDTGDSRLSDARTPTAHALAGAEHTPSTLAALNTKVSDATLIDTGDSRLSDARTPTAHKASHVSGGSDPFTATDLLEALVKRLRESGGQDLLLGAIADGQFLKRDGTGVVGAAVATEVDLLLRVQQNEFGIGGVGIAGGSGTFIGESYSVKTVTPDPPDGPGEAFLLFDFRLPDNYKAGSAITVSLGLIDDGTLGDAIIRIEAHPVSTGAVVPAAGPFDNIAGDVTVAFSGAVLEKKFAVLPLDATTPYVAGDNIFVKIVFDRDAVGYTAGEFDVVDADIVVRATLI